MKKTIAIICVILSLLTGSVTIIPAENIKINIETVSGNTLCVGGMGPGNYTSIQDAINDSTNGDTVFVYSDSSPYYEYIEIDKSIILNGENKDTTIINGSKTEERSCIEIFTDYVTISNISIRNSRGSGAYIDKAIGIKAENCKYAAIKDCIISNNRYQLLEYGIGVSLTDVNHSIIKNCSFSDNGKAVTLKRASINTIENCKFIKNYYGIKLYSSSRNNISKNFISAESIGIDLHVSSNNEVTENNINNASKYGIWITGFDNEKPSIDCIKNVISKNTITNCEKGIYFHNYNSNNEVSKNNIVKNKCGIYLQEFSSKNIIIYNNINNNDVGINIEYYFWNYEGNLITENNIFENIEDAKFRSPNCLPNSKFYKNYWGKTLFLPKRIHGKITIKGMAEYDLIRWVQFDWHPAKQPYNIESNI